MIAVKTITTLEIDSDTGFKGTIKTGSSINDRDYFFYVDKSNLTNIIKIKMSRNDVQEIIDDLSKVVDLIDSFGVAEKLTVDPV